MIFNEDEYSRHGDKVSLVIQDRATIWRRSYGAKEKSAHEVTLAFNKQIGPKVKPQLVYSDGSKEIDKSMKTLEYPHDTSTPYRPQTNGIAERAVRRVKEGTTCVLVQSGLNYEWWREAQEFFCFAFCVTEVMLGGFTPYESRFSKKLDGPIYPCWM